MANTSDVTRTDSVGSWSAEKHLLLGNYLSAYTTVMKGQRWCRGYHYFDGFAGTGRPELHDAETRRYIDGSPRVALNISNPFTSYTFIEMTPWRAARLYALQDEFPGRRIHVRVGDCNRVIVERVVPRMRANRWSRGFVFLDPFGINLAWDTIQAIAETGNLEIMLNFPTMGLNRAALPNKPGALTEQNAEMMSLVWGSDEWRQRLYVSRPTLFGDEWECKRSPTSALLLGRLFVEHRLKKIFPHVTEPIVMRNSQGSPIYCLIFAGHHPKGAEIASDIFERHERRRGGAKRSNSTPVPVTLPLLDLTG